jgi:hypothetical protein
MEWIMALFETSYEHEITCQRPLLWCRIKKSGGGVEGRRQEGHEKCWLNLGTCPMVLVGGIPTIENTKSDPPPSPPFTCF